MLDSGKMTTTQHTLNQFSLDFYKQVTADADKSNNVFFSPISIASALMLVYAGAKGDTAKELSSAVHLNNSNNQELLAAFQTATSFFQQADAEKGFSLNLANRVFVDKTCEVKDSYKSTVQSKLARSARLTSRAMPLTPGKKSINGWRAKPMAKSRTWRLRITWTKAQSWC